MDSVTNQSDTTGSNNTNELIITRKVFANSYTDPVNWGMIVLSQFTDDFFKIVENEDEDEITFQFSTTDEGYPDFDASAFQNYLDNLGIFTTTEKLANGNTYSFTINLSDYNNNREQITKYIITEVLERDLFTELQVNPGIVPLYAMVLRLFDKLIDQEEAIIELINVMEDNNVQVEIYQFFEEQLSLDDNSEFIIDISDWEEFLQEIEDSYSLTGEDDSDFSDYWLSQGFEVFLTKMSIEGFYLTVEESDSSITFTFDEDEDEDDIKLKLNNSEDACTSQNTQFGIELKLAMSDYTTIAQQVIEFLTTLLNAAVNTSQSSSSDAT
ncbi:MAG: hypothetical protein GY874_08150 [Desulfobacteraceae bacterium]|nr:hypothetical protein [Desulfobacteraceae bacterium]